MGHTEAVSSTASGALPSPSSSTKRHREEEPTPASRTNDDSERAERKARKKEKKRMLRQKEHDESDEPGLQAELSHVVSNEAASLIDDERAAKKLRKAEKKARKLADSTELTLERPKSEDDSRPVENAAGAPRKVLKVYDKNADMDSIVEATAGMDEEQMLRFFTQPAAFLQVRYRCLSEPKLPVTTTRKGETLFDGLSFPDFLASSSIKLNLIFEIAEQHGFEVTKGRFTPTEDKIIEDFLFKYSKSQEMEWDDLLEFLRAPSTDDIRKACWYELTKALKCRPLRIVREHVRAKYLPVARKGRFSPEETTNLMDAVKRHGTTHWTVIGEIVGRPPTSCFNKWRKVTFQEGGSGRWSSEEMELLKKAVAKFGEGAWQHHLAGKHTKFPKSLRGPLVQAISLQRKKNIERVKWGKIRVDALADYSERRLLNTWLIMSKDAVAAGVSPDDFPAQVAWAVAQHSAVSNDDSSDEEVSEEE
ncbi:hypothetical protein RQP46_003482 [Phenoliferia psychrophenolica]